MLGFLHTAESHIATFDQLIAEKARGLVACHLVRADLLDRARSAPDDPTLAPSVADALQGLLQSGARLVLCTCSTLGQMAESLSPQVMRIDRPMAEQAIARGGPILLAACLESTLRPSLGLLASLPGAKTVAIETLVMPELWPLFEQGRRGEFISGIIERLRPKATGFATIMLAQASMADAASAFPHALASPRSGLDAALAKIGWQPRPL